uniref:Immunoglobulin I-set domain-containing protein n=1 Tax=Meloidogyne javanica TaxID=6303 RepID=A0A915N9I3_MELJA
MFTEPLNDLVRKEGQISIFQTVVSPFDEVQITWYKDGCILDEPHRFILTNDDGLLILFLEHSLVRDSGVYTILAHNAAGHSRISARLTVTSVPNVQQIQEALVENENKVQKRKYFKCLFPTPKDGICTINDCQRKVTSKNWSRHLKKFHPEFRVPRDAMKNTETTIKRRKVELDSLPSTSQNCNKSLLEKEINKENKQPNCDLGAFASQYFAPFDGEDFSTFILEKDDESDTAFICINFLLFKVCPGKADSFPNSKLAKRFQVKGNSFACKECKECDGGYNKYAEFSSDIEKNIADGGFLEDYISYKDNEDSTGTCETMLIGKIGKIKTTNKQNVNGNKTTTVTTTKKTTKAPTKLTTVDLPKTENGNKGLEATNQGGIGSGRNKHGLPDGYACITGCNPSIIKLKAVNGHPSPVDDGPREKNGCQTDVLSCTTRQPIATIAFGNKGRVQAKNGDKRHVRAQIFCVEKKTEGWVEKGWFRVGANNNPNTFFFVKEAHCEQSIEWNNGWPVGYACITGCNPSSIKLKAEGQPSPVDEGPIEKNGCLTDVLSCTVNRPIATIAFTSKESVQSTLGDKRNVRVKVFCAEEKETGKKGWIRIGANNNPKLFFFVEEAYCEQTTVWNTVNGQPSPVDEGPDERNGCQTDVLSCTTRQPIATIAFGNKGSVQSTIGDKRHVRAKVICAEEIATGKKGWLRNGAHCEQTIELNRNT